MHVRKGESGLVYHFGHGEHRATLVPERLEDNATLVVALVLWHVHVCVSTPKEPVGKGERWRVRLIQNMREMSRDTASERRRYCRQDKAAPAASSPPCRGTSPLGTCL
jgi:hypothetical protein